MYEIKIRFKSGEIGYFKSENNGEQLMLRIFDVLGDSIKDGVKGVIELIELTDKKRTIINISDITSFGYSFIDV